MPLGYLQASRQYWNQKRHQWVARVLSAHYPPLTTSQAVSTYIRTQGRARLIAELQHDNAVFSGRICETINNPEFDLATEVGLDVIGGFDPWASEALGILTDAVQAVCASRRTQNVAPPLLLAGLAGLLLVVLVFRR